MIILSVCNSVLTGGGDELRRERGREVEQGGMHEKWNDRKEMERVKKRQENEQKER